MVAKVNKDEEKNPQHEAERAAHPDTQRWPVFLLVPFYVHRLYTPPPGHGRRGPDVA